MQPCRESLPVLNSPRMTLRPLTHDDVRPLAQALAADPVSSRWWSTSPETNERWLREMEAGAFVIEVAGARAGVVAFEDSLEPEYRFAHIDIALLGPYTGQGLGPASIRVLARWLVRECGHHRFTIDPSVHNARAIRAYEKVGFKPIGVLRRYERQEDGSWGDCLYMDLLAEELTPDD